MENISLIKVHSLYLKDVFNLYEKIGNYFWDNPIIGNLIIPNQLCADNCLPVTRANLFVVILQT